MRNWIAIVCLLALFTQGCAYFVTKDEVSDVRTRIDRISKMVKERRIEEKELGVAIGKARKELARIMEAREKYRTGQTVFIRKVRADLELLKSRIEKLEGMLSSVSAKVKGELKRETDETAAVLKERARELVELENTISALAAFSLKHKPGGLAKIIKALADAKEWRLLHGYLGTFAIKHKSHKLLGESIKYSVEKLFAAAEYGKVIIYGTLYIRQFPGGAHEAAMLHMVGETYYKLSNCTKALLYLNLLVKDHGADARAATVKELIKTISSQRHSRQYCAQ